MKTGLFVGQNKGFVVQKPEKPKKAAASDDKEGVAKVALRPALRKGICGNIRIDL